MTALGFVRRDMLPEHVNYRDKGCHVAPVRAPEPHNGVGNRRLALLLDEDERKPLAGQKALTL